MKTVVIFIGAFLLSLVNLAVVGAASFTGTAKALSDGDTITVLVDQADIEAAEKEGVKLNKQERIRLSGVDCPETKKQGKKGQPYGEAAKKFTRELVIGKRVTVAWKKRGPWKRILGTVVTESGKDLQKELLKAGLAWWYWWYSDDTALGMLEVQAKAKKKGLWRQRDPVAPWLYRHCGCECD